MKFSFSKFSLLICYLLIFLIGVFYFPKWKQSGTEATISWDVSGYYMYLPAFFIYKDLKQCGFKDYVIEKYRPAPTFDLAYRHSSGNYVMKYSWGQAIILSPFFLAGHLFAITSHKYEADGFSFPYQLFIGIGALFYAFLGLWFLRKVLLNYFSEQATGLTLIAIVFASNYLDYAAIDGAMTHNTLFAVYSLLLYVTIRFYQKPGYWKAAQIGFIVGLATLTRPTEIISAILPFSWEVANFADIKNRLSFITRYKQYYITALVISALVISIQPVYWKWVSGDWLVYSYQNEGFSFSHPHVFLCSTSYRSGWLIYSPIMLLSLLGFLTLFISWRKIFLPIFVFCAVFTWICFSWNTWWYGGSLGQRAMVQSYPVYAFPMASLISYCISKRFSKYLLACFMAFCTWYNLWLTHQCHRGGLYRPGEMTKPYFWKTFGRLKVDERVETLLDNDDLYEGDVKNPTLLYQDNFDTDTSAHTTTENAIEGRSIFLDGQHQFSPEYNVPLPPADKRWIRASAIFRIGQKEWTNWKMTQFALRFYKDEKLVQSSMVRVQRILKDNETKQILLDARIPGKDFNKITIVFWNSEGEKKVIIDNLKLTCF